MTTKHLGLLALTLTVALLAGCSGGRNLKEAPVVNESTPAASSQGAGQAGGATQSSSATATGAGATGQAQVNELNNPASPLSKRTIYFAFDSSEIDQKYMPILKAHADYLAAHPNVTMTVEGNTDERGTREYNLALGQRRAEAVKRVLTLDGAADGQVKTVSYGEEHPVALGHNEAAWAKNRRADLVYSNAGTDSGGSN